MMIPDIASSARDLSRNPLGIIALFIVLVYGFACLLFWSSSDVLHPAERTPLIWFVVVFPVAVLCLFGWLVSRHHDKLYSPADYRDDSSFLKTIRQSPTPPEPAENNPHIEQLMEYGRDFELVKDQIDVIKKELDSRKIQYDSEAAQILIRHLAGSYVLTWFERVYATIFGSQIRLLTDLNEKPEGMTFDELALYFGFVKAGHAEMDKWGLDTYLEYLFASSLIETRDRKCFITREGREFLRIFAESGYSADKAF